MKKIIQFIAVIVLVFSAKIAVAQNVGVNATGAAPNASAGLDVDFTNKGLLVPRVALTQTTSNAPIGAGITTSLLVYNTATVNDVTPGYYYWDGAKWSRMAYNLMNPAATTGIGKFYVGPFNLAANSTLTLSVGDPNCVAGSQISVSFAGLLPGSNAQNANIRIYNVSAGAGLWVVQITNLNALVNYNGLWLAYTALY